MLKKQQAVWLVGSLVAVTALDLASKHWAWTRLRGGEPVPVLAPVLELEFAFNPGTAFSLIRVVDHPWVFAALALVAISGVLAIGLRSGPVTPLRLLALGSIAGGALGNVHDRLFRADALGQHGVVDFIVIHYPWGGSWPTFNVADVALVVGTAVLTLSLMRQGAPAAEGARREPT